MSKWNHLNLVPAEAAELYAHVLFASRRAAEHWAEGAKMYSDEF